LQCSAIALQQLGQENEALEVYQTALGCEPR